MKHTLRSRYAALILFAVLMLIMTACGSATDDASQHGTVKIAVSLPLAVEPGQDLLKGVELALNARDGKVGNVKVELLVLNGSDDSGPFSADAELIAAQTAIDDAAVVAYIGPYTSGQTSVSLPLLNQASLIQTSTATWPGLTKPGYGPGEPGLYYPTGKRTFFRAVPSDDTQALAGAQVLNAQGLTRVYVVDDSSKYGAGVAGILEVTVHDLGMTVLGHAQFDPATATDATYAALAVDILATAPDVVYFGGYADDGGGDLLLALRQADPNVGFMGADALLTQSLIDDYDPALAEGVYATHVVVPADQLDTEAAAHLIELYNAAYGTETVPLLVVSSYEATNVFLDAIEHAESLTREGVYKALRDMGTYSGVLGEWSFDVNGDITPASITVWQVVDGEWAFVELIQ